MIWNVVEPALACCACAAVSPYSAPYSLVPSAAAVSAWPWPSACAIPNAPDDGLRADDDQPDSRVQSWISGPISEAAQPNLDSSSLAVFCAAPDATAPIPLLGACPDAAAFSCAS